MASKRGKLVLGSSLLLLCLVWMDACLYYQIQSIDDIDPVNESTPQMPNYHNSTSTGGFLVDVPPLMDKFSFAFHGMSVKLMMTDPVDNYLLAPLSDAFVDVFDLKNNFHFLTPNMISYAGVVSALIAAKLVTYNSPTMHKLSFVMFQLRTWLDDLDGAVARVRLGISQHVSLQKTSGYIVDGVCDAIGFIAYIIGCYIFMKNSISKLRRHEMNRRGYSLQSITEFKTASPSTYVPLQQDDYDDEYDDNDEVAIYERSESYCGNYQLELEKTKTTLAEGKSDLIPNHHDDQTMGPRKRSRLIFYKYIRDKIRINFNNRHLVLLIACFLIQLAMCATFWNRYILVYRDLLESPSSSAVEARVKRKILKSNVMYVIIWFWRLTNGHSYMQMLITAVIFGKLWQFLECIKFVGFIGIVILATVTELHTIDVRNFIHELSAQATNLSM